MTSDRREHAASADARAERQSDDELVLALDQGGQSSRAIVFDATGHAVSRSSRAVAEQRIGDDRVEQDPEEIVRSVSEAADEAVGMLGPRARSLARAGLATQRSSLVCWDLSSGSALSPVISWQDRRAAAWLERFAADADAIHRRTGLFLSPHYGASKLAWCLEHLPEVASARVRGTLAMGPLASFLVFRLLRERPFVVDPANASRTLLQSIAAQAWSPDLCALFGIPAQALPRCVPTHSAFGTLAVGDIDVPMRVVTGDQSSAIFAEGEPRADTAYVNLGTGAFVQRPFAGELVVLPRLLTSVVSSGSQGASDTSTAGNGPTFVIEGTINGAGSALRLIGEELGLADVDALFDAWLAASREPALFLNGVSGLAAPYWAPSFASRFVGDGTAEERIVAVAESILFLVKIILDEMETALAPAQRVQVSGGLAQSDALCARLADLVQRPVLRTIDPEATARGLAWQLLGATRTWRASAARTFEPRANASLAARQARFRVELERALGLEA